MNLKDKIKILASLGIIVSTTSCVDENDMIINPNSDIEPKNQIKNGSFKEFTPMKGIMLSSKLEKELMVLGRLAKDALLNPENANDFSKNPEEYLKKNGIINADFDLESVETRVILALGDSDIRESLSSNNITKFVNLLHEKKYIEYNNLKLNNSLESYIEYHSKKDPDFAKTLNKYLNDPEIEAAVFFATLWVVAVVIEEVAAVYNVGAAVNVEFYFNVHSDVNAWGDAFSDALYDIDSYVDYNVGISLSALPKDEDFKVTTKKSENMVFNNPILKLWSYNKNGKDIFVVDEVIDRNVEETAKFVENLDVFKNPEKKLDPKKLRAMLKDLISKNISRSKLL